MKHQRIKDQKINLKNNQFCKFLSYNLRNRKMPQFFSLPFFQQKLSEYDPMQQAYGIAQKCRTCNLKIIHNQCITPCGCYRYCHEKCLIQQINTANKKKDQKMYRCQVCKKTLCISYNMQILTKLHLTKFNIFLIVLSFLWLPLTIYSAILYKNDPIILAFDSFVITFLISVLGYAVINSFMVKQFTATNVRSTQLGLMISAFVDLEKEIQEQTTHTEMIR